MTMLERIRRPAFAAAIAIAGLTLAMPARADISLTLTDFNSNNQYSQVGATTAGMNVLTVSSNTGLLVGDTITGAGIPGGTIIAGFVGTTGIILSQAATSTTAGTVTVTQAGGVTTTFTQSFGGGNALFPLISQLLSYSNAQFGNMQSLTLTSTASVLTSPTTAQLTNDNIDTKSTATSGLDTLTAVITTSSTTSPGGLYNQPSGNPLSLSSSISTSSLSTGTVVGAAGSATFTSSLTSDGFSNPPTPATSVVGAGTNVAVSGPTTFSTVQSNGLFNLSNTLTVFLAGGETATVDGTTNVTAVPEPSTYGLALSGGLLILAFGWARRRGGAPREAS